MGTRMGIAAATMAGTAIAACIVAGTLGAIEAGRIPGIAIIGKVAN